MRDAGPASVTRNVDVVWTSKCWNNMFHISVFAYATTFNLFFIAAFYARARARTHNLRYPYRARASAQVKHHAVHCPSVACWPADLPRGPPSRAPAPRGRSGGRRRGRRGREGEGFLSFATLFLMPFAAALCARARAHNLRYRAKASAPGSSTMLSAISFPYWPAGALVRPHACTHTHTYTHVCVRPPNVQSAALHHCPFLRLC
jgi:hypothetical protein